MAGPLYPTEERFREIYNVVADYIEDVYKVPVVIADVTNWKERQPLLTPLPIPVFTPTRWVSRWQGIVL
ncbi:MAG TPA: hypothetical protein VMV18_03550 [bacterium]|nr:hypothetical protein [bacterium]